MHPEVNFAPDRPILTSAGPLDLVHSTPDQLWVHDLLNLQPGARLQQEIHIGNLVELFKMFSQEWSDRWNRHLDLPDGRWQHSLDFIDQHVPYGPVMKYQPISLDEWKDCLRRKKRTAAVGPDGWSREDLLSLPDDLTSGILAILAEVEAGAPWPQSMMTGLIHSLQKIPTAHKVGHYRPITLCSLLYRIWSSIRSRQLLTHFMDQTPMGISGNVPGKTTKHLWYTIQLQIEQANAEGDMQSGCVVDLVKAFNLLPREPLIAACVKLGAPGPVLRAWSSALHQLQRRFIIRGGASPPLRSVTGFPEGCGMSVVAMLATNIVASHWLRHQQPQVCVHSFVDNIELTAPASDDVSEGFGHLCDFFSHLDLEWDPDKTYFWSNTASERAQFRQADHTLRPWARDLGAHMQYSRAATNAVITDKIAQFQPQWKQLSRSHASARQKKLALVVAAWPNMLHGISSVHLGTAHFQIPRTKAVRSFSDPTPGTSPLATLSLCEHPRLDPEFFALWSTLLDFRALTTRDSAHMMLTSASAPTDRVRPHPGPCHVVLKRLHDIGWSWEGRQGFLDHTGSPFDAWDSNFQEFQLRLVEAWQSRQCATLSHRKTFAGMATVHAKFTTESKVRCDMQLGVLTTCLDGTFYTADHLKHRTQPGSTQCPFCGQEDSAFHRNWICPALESARTDCPPDVRASITSQLPCSSCHGWFPAPAQVQVFRAHLASLDDEHHDFVFPPQLAATLDIFTDGACLMPHDSFCRWASWGIAIAQVETGTFVPVASGLLGGIIQSVVRAEFRAVLAAVHFAICCRRPFRLWIDNQQVFQFLNRLLAGETPKISPNRPNHDIKHALSDVFGLVAPHCQGIFKVYSHQHLPSLDGLDRWAGEGNAAADAVASQVFADHACLLDAWHSLVADCTAARRVRDAVHQVLIRVGALAISRLSSQGDPDLATPVSDFVPLPTVLQPWTFPSDLPPEAATFHIQDWGDISAWIHSLHSEGDLHYLSWYHLFVDFSLYTLEKVHGIM